MSDDLQWVMAAQLEVISQTTGGQTEKNREVHATEDVKSTASDQHFQEPQATKSHMTTQSNFRYIFYFDPQR